MTSHARWPARARLAGALATLLGLIPAGAAGEDPVTLTGAPIVRLWRSPAALEAAARNPNPAAPGLEQPACAVPRGTRALVIRVPDSYAWQAEVVEGPHAGCRGVVSPRDFEAGTPVTSGGLSQERVGAAPPAPGAAGAAESPWVLWEHWRSRVLESMDPPTEEWHQAGRRARATECEAAKQEQIRKDDLNADDVALRLQARAQGRAGRDGGTSRVTALPMTDGWDLTIVVRGASGLRTRRIELRYSCHPANQPPPGAPAGRPGATR